MVARSTGGSLIDDAKLKQLYATMLQCRLLTEHARSHRRYGALYSASMGQEAIATGCAIDLSPQDTIALAPHNSIASLVKGAPLSDIVAQLHARRSKAVNREHNIIGPSSNPGEQLKLASRVALDNKKQKNTNVVVAFTSAAATTLDGWHDSLTLAAKRNLPIIFVVENNPWTSARRRRSEDLALKARRDGLTTITVDGNDVVAVYRVAYESLQRVRCGGGPVLVEGKTYCRDDQHSHSAERDPLTHMERYLQRKKLFNARWKNQLVRRFSRELEAAVRKLDLPV
jgi:TPP-dependent pyruvate/acetoin dehydrogenase alpha subunit